MTVHADALIHMLLQELEGPALLACVHADQCLTVLQVNSAMAQQLGVSDGQMLAGRDLNQLPISWQSPVLQSVARDGERRETLINWPGERRPKQMSVSRPLPDYLLLRVLPDKLGVSADLLIEERRKYRQLLETANEAILQVDTDLRIQYANAQAGRMLGFPMHLLLGRRIDQLIHSEDRCQFHASHASGPYGMRDRLLLRVSRADGSTGWGLLSIAPMFGPADDYIGSMVMLSDVSALQEAEQALAVSEAQYRQLFDNAQVGIARMRVSDGRLMDVNRRFAEYFGYPDAEAMIDRSLSDFCLEDHQCRQMTAMLSRRGWATQWQGQFRGVDDRLIWLEVSFWLDETGQRMEMVAVDITAVKSAEHQVRDHHQQLLHADRMIALGTLVSGVAHEINNPNHFIKLNAQVLQELQDPLIQALDDYEKQCGPFMLGRVPYRRVRERLAQVIAGVGKGADRIERIVSELRRYVRDQGAAPLTPLNLNDVVRAAGPLLAGTVRKATDDYRVELTDDLPMIYGNAQRLEQVIINLVTNACQALTDGGQAVVVKTVYVESDQQVQLQVIDDGSGIDPAHLNQLADPFFTTRRDAGGTGLGLAVSVKIIEEHGGSVVFDSRLGEGTCVIVRFPVADVDGCELSQ